ncbi:hypothetical protein CR513_21958, partial [Mucuna pruriens]
MKKWWCKIWQKLKAVEWAGWKAQYELRRSCGGRRRELHLWLAFSSTVTLCDCTTRNNINFNDLLLRRPNKALIPNICKMHGFSTVDGFEEISNCMAEMIKYMAKEPSAGLFFIQQHTQNAVPNVVKLKNNVVDESHETTLHAQDLEDSVATVRSMKECGFTIADEMIQDIKKSLLTLTTKQPKGGLIRRLAPNFQTERAKPSVYVQEGSEIRGNYFSSIFMFSNQKTSTLNWPQLGSTALVNSKAEKPQLYLSVSSSDTAANTTACSQTDKHPLSSKLNMNLNLN